MRNAAVLVEYVVRSDRTAGTAGKEHYSISAEFLFVVLILHSSELIVNRKI